MPQKKISYEDWKKKYNKTESPDYKLKQAYNLGYTPDKKGHLPTVNHKTGEFLKSSKHPTVKQELDWYNSKEASSFREKNKIDSTEEFWKYVPKLKEGGKMPLKKESGIGCVTAGGCSKPKPPRLKPEVERSVAASIDRSARSESERRNMYERAGIQYQSVSASTRPARTFGIPGNQQPEIKKELKTHSRKVIKKRPQEETISKPDTTYKYYKRSSGEEPFQEKNLKATSKTPLSSFNKGGKMLLKKASGKGKDTLAARKK